MSKYKEIMLNKGIMQKEVLDGVRRVDSRYDKSLLSKVVNDLCVPTPPVLDNICKTLGCAVLDIYDQREITYTTPVKAVATEAERKRKHRREADVYNLTVEIPRSSAERIFAPAAMQKLGYVTRSDFVRQAVTEAMRRLDEIEAKEKAAAHRPPATE